MIYSAIIAIKETRAQEFEDADDNLIEAFLGNLTPDLRRAVESKSKAGLKGQITENAIAYRVYLVYGTEQALADAAEFWGTDMLIGDTWTKGDRNTPACRAGFKYETQIDTTDPENPVINKIRVGQEVRPRHPNLLDWLDDIPARLDKDGIEIEPAKRPTNFNHLPRILGHGTREL